MYRELINTLAYTYSIITRGKGIINSDDMDTLVRGACTLTATVPMVEKASGKSETENDKQILKEAQKMRDQIEEMEMFLLNLEIC